MGWLGKTWCQKNWLAGPSAGSAASLLRFSLGITCLGHTCIHIPFPFREFCRHPSSLGFLVISFLTHSPSPSNRYQIVDHCTQIHIDGSSDQARLQVNSGPRRLLRAVPPGEGFIYTCLSTAWSGAVTTLHFQVLSAYHVAPSIKTDP